MLLLSQTLTNIYIYIYIYIMGTMHSAGYKPVLIMVKSFEAFKPIEV